MFEWTLAVHGALDECYEINMLDSFGDGWNGNNLDVNGQQFTISSGSSASEFMEGAEGSCSDFDLSQWFLGTLVAHSEKVWIRQ